MSKNSAVRNFDKSLEEERVRGPQEGKGAVIFNNGGGNGGNGGNGSNGNNENRNGNGRSHERRGGNEVREEEESSATSVTLRRNLQESAENSEMLSQFRNSINEAVPKYIDAIDQRISEVEEELKALRQEKNTLMNLTDSIRVFN